MEEAGLALFFEPVAVALDVEDGGTVQEPIESSAGEDGVAGEDIGPVAEGLVGGDDDGVIALVAVAEDLEEEAGLCRVETEVADLIDDEEFGLGQRLDGMAKTVLGEGGAACEPVPWR